MNSHATLLSKLSGKDSDHPTADLATNSNPLLSVSTTLLFYQVLWKSI